MMIACQSAWAKITVLSVLFSQGLHYGQDIREIDTTQGGNDPLIVTRELAAEERQVLLAELSRISNVAVEEAVGSATL
jgi:hypothetical protein